MKDLIKKTIHIGPVFGSGMGTVIQGYIKLLGLPKENAWNSHKENFVKSLPCLFSICIRILLKKQKDIICFHIHLAERGSALRKFIIGLCLKLANKKFLVHLHGADFQKEFSKTTLTRMLTKMLIKMSNAIICITEDMKIFIEKENLNCRIFVISNLCETIAERPVDLENRNEDICIVYAGRYGERKGVYDLLAAFEKANFNAPVHLDLYGDGEVEKVKEIVAKSAKKHLITVHGWTAHSEYIKRLPEYDFLVLPTYAEVFPMSILESMGFGIPVVSTYAGGIPEMIENNKTGILFEAGNIEKLTSILEKFSNDKNLRIELGESAWKDAKARFSPEIILEKLDNIYGSI